MFLQFAEHITSAVRRIRLKKLLSMLIGVLVFACSAPSRAATFTVPEEDAGRVVYIYGAIGGRSALATAGQIEKMSMGEGAGRPIYIVINSPGGEVLTGLQIVSAIQVAKSRGSEVKCVVGMLAASMASIIYDECSERYALRQSLLLWHPIATTFGGLFGGRLTPEVANTLAFGLESLQGDIPRKLQKSLGFDDKTWHYLFDGEAFITARWLHSHYNPHYLDLVDDVVGISPNVSLFSLQMGGSDDLHKQPVSPASPKKQEDPADIFPSGPEWIPASLIEALDPETAEQLKDFASRHPEKLVIRKAQ